MSAAPIQIHTALGEIVECAGEGIYFAKGTAVPADGVIGYAKGCQFIHSDGANANSLIYVNTGTVNSAAFKFVPAMTQQSALTAENGGTVDGTYGAEEAAVLSNAVTRIGEIEAALQAIGLLP